MRWLCGLAITLLIIVGAMVYAQAPAAQPQITKAVLKARLAELQRGRDQAMADVNAYNGAIQECQYWMDWLDKQAKPEPKK